MKKLAVILCILLLLTGCGETSYLSESEGDPISPVQDSAVISSASVMPLYFRFYDEPMLVRCPLTLEISSEHPAEYYAVEALLAGPTGQLFDKTACFSKTTLIGVSDGRGCLNVTLGDDFLSDTKGATEEETFLNRRLALYSIVNTVCEMGTYSYVQIYLSGSGAVYRPQTYDMGLARSQSESVPLAPISRNTSLILTPSGVARMALQHYAGQEWAKCYRYLGDRDSDTARLPLMEEMARELEYLGLIMREYSVEDGYTVSDDGGTAMVQISFKIRTASTSYTVSNVPLTLVSKQGSWFVDYESFRNLLEVQR